MLKFYDATRALIKYNAKRSKSYSETCQLMKPVKRGYLSERDS